MVSPPLSEPEQALIQQVYDMHRAVLLLCFNVPVCSVFPLFLYSAEWLLT
ncbi:unnamed protein product [Staurois parvus]|uniref:Uncharacterized protein n=1 Tax=Staurois parvus TaxID=386267 RepID=A0ABN9ATX6_9NEOB|nr:unnamed protein product [Staurois parvus]